MNLADRAHSPVVRKRDAKVSYVALSTMKP
jgi:hypothetical protein